MVGALVWLSGGKMRVPEGAKLCTFRFQNRVGDTVGDTVGGTSAVWFTPP